MRGRVGTLASPSSSCSLRRLSDDFPRLPEKAYLCKTLGSPSSPPLQPFSHCSSSQLISAASQNTSLRKDPSDRPRWDDCPRFCDHPRSHLYNPIAKSPLSPSEAW